tara:strand:- start:296 stop:973 length:678 start_codon:yes stop_codon:yes gene_type:complete
MTYTVYQLQHPITKQIKYIGITKDPLFKRLGYHLVEQRYTNKRDWIADIFETTGQVPLITKITIAKNKQEALKLEKFYIKQYLSNSLLNYLGPKKGGSAKRVYQYTLKGKFIKEWPSSKAAEKYYGINNVAICAHDNKKGRKSAGGYLWSFLKHEKINPIKRHLDSRKTVYQFDLQGNLISEYESASCAIKDGFSKKMIWKCCVGKNKTHQGYFWSYDKIPTFKI